MAERPPSKAAESHRTAVADAPTRWRRRAQRAIALGIASVVAFIVVVVWLSFAGRDVHPYRASSAEAGWATEGLTNEKRPFGLIVHTRNENQPWLEIDLGEAQTIERLVIANRRSCCQERAAQIDVALSTDGEAWTVVHRNEEEFDLLRLAIEPQPARFVRVSARNRTILHLEAVEAW